MKTGYQLARLLAYVTAYGLVIQLALRRAKQRRGHLVTSIVAASKDSQLVASTRQ
jgi:hypothetical protein